MDYESDGEHPELGLNWRCRRLFNGKVRENDLFPNCSRPQTDDGRSFSTVKSYFYEHDTEQKFYVIFQFFLSNLV